MTALIAGFLVLSGAAALTYQVAWVRLLGLSMGSSSASVSTVLAAFFLGLAAGSYLAERLYRRRTPSLRIYLALEALIGASGLALLPALLGLDNLVARVPELGSLLAFKFAVALLLLALPTLCMGATFPVLATLVVQRDGDVGSRLSLLYGLNTLGAVAGAALGGFLFIPQWGLDGAVFIAATLNGLIVVVGIVALSTESRAHAKIASAPPSAEHEHPLPPLNWDQRRALVVLFATGFASIATQVGWTKYLSIFTGTTVYGFAAILTVFLTGITAGSLAMKRVLPKVHAPEWWLAAGLLALGLSLVLTRAAFGAVPALYGAINHLGAEAWLIHFVKYMLVFALLITPTFLFGALFPLNLAIFCDTAAGVRKRVGRAYAVNTVASILGAVCAGFWFIPTWGTDKLLTAMAAIILLLPFLFAPSFRTGTRQAALVAGAGTVLFLGLAAPHLDYRALIASVQYGDSRGAGDRGTPHFHFLQEGHTGVISVVSDDGKRARLQNNGLNESVFHLHDPDEALLAETLLGVAPYALQDEPRSAFVVGFGGGITTRALTLTDLREIHVTELEPAIMDAARAINSPGSAALNDPRVRLTLNDARNVLLTEERTYDIIAAQPSHPWLARASNVFTQEFWQIAHRRLNTQGVFAQWVNLFNMDATTLRSIFKAFYSVFPHGFTMTDFATGDLLLIGAKVPVKFKLERWAKLLTEPHLGATFARFRIARPQDFLWHFGLSRADALAAAGEARPNTDTNILSEVRLSALVSQPRGAENVYVFLKNHSRFDFSPYYVGVAPHQFLYDQAQRFMDGGNFYIARRIRERLQELEPRLGRSLALELHWRQFNFNAVLELYRRDQEWTDRAHLLHALTLLELGRQDQALAALDSIEEESAKQDARARLLFEAAAWSELEDLGQQTDEQRRWQLAARAAQGIPQPNPGEATRLIGTPNDSIALLRALLADAVQRGDTRAMDLHSRELADAIDEETARLAKLATRLLDKRDPATAFLVLRRLERTNPEADGLRVLRNRLERFSLSSSKPLTAESDTEQPSATED